MTLVDVNDPLILIVLNSVETISLLFWVGFFLFFILVLRGGVGAVGALLIRFSN